VRQNPHPVAGSGSLTLFDKVTTFFLPSKEFTGAAIHPNVGLFQRKVTSRIFPPVDRMAVSFSGCGFIGVYHIGAASCLQTYAPFLLRHGEIIGGDKRRFRHENFDLAVTQGRGRVPYR